MKKLLFIIILVVSASSQSKLSAQFPIDPSNLYKFIGTSFEGKKRQFPNLLFYLERNYREKNIVLYETAAGNRVTTRWHMGEKGNGIFEAMDADEKPHYGISHANGVLKLNQVPSKPIQVSNGSAYITLNGQKVRLLEVHVEFNYDFLGIAPSSVKYISFYGAKGDGKIIREDVTP